MNMRESAARQSWSAAARALICGYVDAYTFLTFGVYSSFMTGNTTSGGVHAGEIRFAQAAHNLLPIPFFLLGVMIGALLGHADERRALRRLSTLVGVLLLADVAGTRIGCPDWLSIVILSAGMGAMNTSVTQVGGQPVGLGFLTGDLNNLAKLIALQFRSPAPQSQGVWSAHKRVALLASLWMAFIGGAVLGGALAPVFAVWTPLLPAIALLILALPGRSERLAN